MALVAKVVESENIVLSIDDLRVIFDVVEVRDCCAGCFNIAQNTNFQLCSECEIVRFCGTQCRAKLRELHSKYCHMLWELSREGKIHKKV